MAVQASLHPWDYVMYQMPMAEMLMISVMQIDYQREEERQIKNYKNKI